MQLVLSVAVGTRARKHMANPSANWVWEAASRISIWRPIISLRLLGWSRNPHWRGSPVSCIRAKVTGPPCTGSASEKMLQPPGEFAVPKVVFVVNGGQRPSPPHWSDPPPVKCHVPSNDTPQVQPAAEPAAGL